MSYDLSNYVIVKRNSLTRKNKKVKIIYFTHGVVLGVHFCIRIYENGRIYISSRWFKTRRIKLSEYKENIEAVKKALNLTNHKSITAEDLRPNF